MAKMLDILKGATTLAVTRTALERALAMGGPLIVLQIVAKAGKLATAVPSVHDVVPAGSSWFGGLIENPILLAALPTFVLGVLLSYLLRGHRGRLGSVLGWALAVPLVYVAAVAAGYAHGEDHPLSPPIVVLLFEQIEEYLALWWGELLVSALIVVGLSWHYVAAERAPHSWVTRVRGFILWALVVGSLVIVALDLGYFVATGSVLSMDEISYALNSPSDAWVVSSDSLSLAAFLPLICAVTALAASYAIQKRLARRPAGQPEPSRTFRVAPWLYAALGLAAVAPAAPSEHIYAQYSYNPLLQFTVGAAAGSIRRAIVLGDYASGSPRVPRLSGANVEAVATARTKPLNIVIVMLESTRADAVTVYSPSLPTTPFLAELAQESLVVDHMYAVIPRTSAAWIAVLSGRYPGSLGLMRQFAEIPRSGPISSSLPALLRPLGYSSAFITPTRLNYENDSQIMRSLDFDEVLSQKEIPPSRAGQVTAFGWEDNTTLAPIGHWLDERKAKNTPFLLTIMTNVGHFPYSLPPDFPRQHFTSRNQSHENYLNCVHYIDGYLRSLVEELRTRNLLENTVLMILGDHGEEFLDHGGTLRGHGLYDEVLHIPMLIRLPRSYGRTGRIAGLRQQIDIVPTIADALGLQLQGGPLPGASILSAPGHDDLFFSTHNDHSYLAVRDHERKYIFNFNTDQTEVFDLSRDPHEQHDLSSQIPAKVELQAEADLLAWSQRVRTTYLRPRPTAQPVTAFSGGGAQQARNGGTP
jgi:arylsulfatase A-like enzyme